MTSTPILTAAQEQVLALLSTGSTATAAADAAGVHRNTVRNWLRSSLEFRQALALARYESALLWRDKAEALAADAIRAIERMVLDPCVPAAVRLKAALSIVQIATTPPPLPPGEYQSPGLAAWQVTPVAAAQAPPPAPVPAAAPDSMHNTAQPAQAPAAPKIGRNAPCPCRSGKKYKHCCLGKSAPGAPAAAQNCTSAPNPGSPDGPPDGSQPAPPAL